MAYYKDLREQIKALEAHGKLVRIKKPINKDTELIPMVRWQFRGLPEADRKAWLFENVYDVKGKKYNIPVLVASHAASTDVYAIGMMCKPEEITEKWTQAQLHPIEPKMVKSGPVQEEVHLGDKLLEHGGMDEFPVPITTPGFDNGPYIAGPAWITKDLDTGVRNVGTYRGMIKSPTRIGANALDYRHMARHWYKAKERGVPLQAAVVLGATPNVGYCSVNDIPYGVDEYAVAGGLAGEPLELVKCKTVDIEVPATAEIVIEGQIPTDSLEREGPFGEFTGYVGRIRRRIGYMNITCITHRKNPIYSSHFMTQYPPSESSKMREIGFGGLYHKFLQSDCGIPGILDVVFPECGGMLYCVVRIKKWAAAQPRQILNAIAGRNPSSPKITIVVDEDIDPRDPESVIWALTYRVQPHRDMQVTMGRISAEDPSGAPQDADDRRYPLPSGNSALLIDATIKFPYPPVSLPKKEFMEKAKKLWEEEGLPKLTPRVPWYGYPLGYWTKEFEEEAELALKGEHYKTGKKLEQQRVTEPLELGE